MQQFVDFVKENRVLDKMDGDKAVYRLGYAVVLLSSICLKLCAFNFRTSEWFCILDHVKGSCMYVIIFFLPFLWGVSYMYMIIFYLPGARCVLGDAGFVHNNIIASFS